MWIILCVYICVWGSKYICVCLCVHVHICEYTGRRAVNFKCHSSWGIHLIFWGRISLSSSGRLGWLTPHHVQGKISASCNFSFQPSTFLSPHPLSATRTFSTTFREKCKSSESFGKSECWGKSLSLLYSHLGKTPVSCLHWASQKNLTEKKGVRDNFTEQVKTWALAVRWAWSSTWMHAMLLFLCWVPSPLSFLNLLRKVDGRRGPALELSVRFGDAKEKLSEA